MNEAAVERTGPRPAVTSEASSARVLHQLYLTLFLRGRSSRGLKKQRAPVSLAIKLRVILVFYGLLGLLAFAFIDQSMFALAAYQHALTFVFVGMLMVSSAGEVLFNHEEPDILLHRPVTSRALLWAKIAVLLQVSLYLSGAFNLAAFVVGVLSRHGSLWFPLVHAASTTLEALFCAASVVLGYELSLRWFGRERLQGLITTVQVMISVSIVVASQVMPRLLVRLSQAQGGPHAWPIWLLPPAWFAGLDDALIGTHAVKSYQFALMSVVATTVTSWLAFGALATDYGDGLQRMSEVRSSLGHTRHESRSGGRFIDRLAAVPPLSWWLRDPIERASFLLCLAYLLRDRDCKLRVYPSLAPYVAIPFGTLLQGSGGTDSAILLLLVGALLAEGPMLAQQTLRISQNWAASDLFRAVPIAGPAQLCNGARKATILIIGLPPMLLAGLLACYLQGGVERLWLLLPGLISMPVYSWFACMDGTAVPLSLPPEEARGVGRGLSLMWLMFSSLVLAGLAAVAWYFGWFWEFLAVELVAAVIIILLVRREAAIAPWPLIE